MSMTTLASATVSAATSLASLHSAGAARGLLFLQAQDVINSGNSKLLEFFIGLVAVAMVVQAIVVVALAIGLMKAQKLLMANVQEIRGKLMPLINKSHILVNDLAPEIKQITSRVNELTGKANEISTKVNVISSHVENIMGVAKDKVHEFSPTITAANETLNQANDTARDVNEKARQQVSRVNGMVTSTLDATVKLGKAIEHGISQPGRELAGLIAGFRASVDVLMDRARGPRVVRPRTTPPTSSKVTAFRSMADTPYSYTEKNRDIDL